MGVKSAFLVGFALLFFGCSQQADEANPEVATVPGVIDAMHRAESYRVVVSLATRSEPMRLVEVDYESPNEFRVLSHEGESVLEEFWTENEIYRRRCNSASDCDPWATHPKGSSEGPPPGAPLRPVDALSVIQGETVTSGADEYVIEGTAKFPGSRCSAVEGVIGAPESSTHTCTETSAPDSSITLSLKFTVDSETDLITSASIATPIGEYLYEYSDYGKVEVQAPVLD